jgi:iron(III) transport system substrate-binding protein
MTSWFRLTPFLGIALVAMVACAPAAPPSPTAAPAKPAATEAPKPPAQPTAAPAAKPAEAKPAASPAAKAEAQPAASPAAKPAASPAAKAEAKPAADWDTVLAAAKREGKVLVAGPPGTAYREAMRPFEQKYPDVKLEFQGFNPADFVARFEKEREAGQYLWDVYITGPTTFDITGKQKNQIVPIRPALILPEITDEQVWHGGFEKAYLDKEKQFIFAFQAEVNAQAYVNRDIVKEAELNTIKDLLDPKWKGKIAVHDPRVDGAGNGRIAAWIGLLGEDFVRKLLAQDVGLSRDQRQLTEWTIRGQYPIVVGISPTDLVEFTKQNLGKNVMALGDPKAADAWRLSTAFGAVRLVGNHPNPNAANVFINWLLSKEGQTAWVEKTVRTSRRLDAPKIEGVSPIPGVNYFDIDREEALPLRDQAKRISQEVLK